MKTIVLSSLRFAVGAFLGFGSVSAAQAQDTAMPTSLHYFDAREGYAPGQLVEGSDGNFYGTTTYGGFGYNEFQSQSGDGTVYRITPAGGYTTLYAFPGGAKGQNPHALIQGIDGNFYGLTSHGGAVGDGTVFRLTLTGELTTLYSFPDSASVPGPLVQDDSGNFYGVRSAAKTLGGYDASIFRLSPTGEYTTLYTFTGGGDGGTSSGLINGSKGNFYGTSYGGSDGIATIYRITPAGGFTVLHTFTGNDDIFSPSGLTLGSDGNLYGTNVYGGANSRGSVFRLTPAGDYTVLYAFTGGSDGEYPFGRLVEGSDGNFYGITTGTTSPPYYPARLSADADPTPAAIVVPYIPVPPTVFRITPQGVLTSLYANDSALNGFILGGDGNFYGTDDAGVGSVFKLSIVSHPAFFAYQAPLTNGTYYLSFSNGNYFGYYLFQTDPNYLYHIDLGPEYFIDAKDGQEGLYLYDFRSGGFFYTSPTFPFPYLYDFNLQSVVYLFPDPNNAGRYLNTAGAERYFYVFRTETVVLK